MKSSEKELCVNKRAYHHYEILETFEAGLVLLGTEVKSLRDHGGNIADAYIRVGDSEAFLLNASIAPYRFGNIHNHEEKRARKLLLHKREIEKLQAKSQEKGLTIVALSCYLKAGRVKIKIGLAKGKKLFDKREAIKQRESDRAIARQIRNVSR